MISKLLREQPSIEMEPKTEEVKQGEDQESEHDPIKNPNQILILY